MRGLSQDQNFAVVSFPLQEPHRIISQVGIATPIKTDSKTGQTTLTTYERTFRAIWDTGAARTTVVPSVIATANLNPHGYCDNRGIDGIVKRRPVVLASIFMSTRQGDKQALTAHTAEMVVLESDGQLGDVDVLIGMDIISRGDMAITADNKGVLWFSFCHPHRGRLIRFDSKNATIMDRSLRQGGGNKPAKGARGRGGRKKPRR